MLRRTLVILVTALVVARPAVLGEDPGLLDDFSDPSGMVLTLLWFAAAVGWAIWRLLARRAKEPDREGSRCAGGSATGERPPGGAAVVEVALLVTAGVVFVSAEAAAR